MKREREERGDLKGKMVWGMILTLVPMLLVLTLLFWQTRSALKEEYIRRAHSDLREISGEIDEKLEEISYMSDVYAANEQLLEATQKSYQQEKRGEKMAMILRLHREVFDSMDLLNRWEKLGAVYTAKEELLNFLDPNNDTQEVREKLEAMGVNSKDRLMRMVWYPVQENFLRQDLPEDLHERQAIFGSRRVYSWKNKRYEYVQIFALEEKVIYEMYEERAKSLQGNIYVIDKNGGLISSSDEESLKQGELSPNLKELLRERKQDSFEQKLGRENMLISVEESAVNDWLSVMIVPVRVITSEMDALYLQFFVILLICMGISGALMMWLYKSFMEPIGRLNSSMNEVYGGNLDAYVQVKDNSKKNEINEMMLHYNSMLHRINTHIIEGLKADRQKKELELEVLMSQVNPHFLYNTLENIVWKSNEAGCPEIGRMAASLGRMYRLSISGGQIIVPMEHEIEHLMAYVKIQRNRYGDKVNFDLRTDMAEVHELYSLKILLQPLVENSFLYGMEGLERAMTIRVSIRERGGWVQIRVLDDGCGMERERLEQVRTQIERGRKCDEDEERERNRRSTGIGLHSVQLRIKLYFGIENAVSIYSKKGRGTLVVVKIPKIQKEDVDEKGNLKTRIANG
ncbi:MAG: histidine kinase [bacterium]|nr:histidine kinase [bacterium]